VEEEEEPEDVEEEIADADSDAEVADEEAQAQSDEVADDDVVETAEVAETEELTAEEAADVAPWRELFEKMHPAILRGLREAGFLEPTGIQKEVMKPALLARKDVIGAAETVRHRDFSLL
jgi:superfamily II DNA/RNA helicase